MVDSLKSFLDYAKKDPLTTACAVAFALASYISNNPESVTFIGSSASATVVSVSSFIAKAAVAVGLLFAAQTKTKKEEAKAEVILDHKVEIAVEEKIEENPINKTI